jgi:hypothetical protein
MEGIYWAWTRLQYHAVLKSILANILYVQKTVNFLCQLL